MNYFGSLFTSSNPTHIDHALEDFETRVSYEMNANICAASPGEEVQVALSQMHPTKAPGPDGMCHLFFKYYWNLVGPAVTILNSDASPPDINKTFVSYLEKK